MNLLELITVFCVIFIIGILSVMIIRKCTLKDATVMCKGFIKEIISALFAPDPPPVIYYPTIVGWDGNRILLQLVDDAFKTVRQNFAVCFCISAGLSPDGSVVLYRFKTQPKTDAPDEESLSSLIQSQTEEILANTMRLYDCYLPTEPLTIIELFPQELRVAFARTEDGIKKIDSRKAFVRKRKMLSQENPYNTMHESWESKYE